MENYSYPQSLQKASGIIAVVLHPVFLPVYGLLLIFYSPTVLWFLPFEVKKLMLLVYFSTGILIPLSLTPFMINRGILHSWQMEERSDRMVSLLLITVLYGSAAFMMRKWYIPGFLKAFVYTLPVMSGVLLVISSRWKISLHSAGAGSFVALVIVLSVKMSAPLIPFLAVSILLAGIVAASRLIRGAHEPVQVYAGFATGFCVAAASLLLFQQF